MNEVILVKNLIYEIRGYKVMLDSDLASLYEVLVKRLNERVKRNISRFPSNFLFRLSKEEWLNLRSQFATLKKDIRKYPPYVFTEQGVAMLSSVLNSEKAIQINIQIMNTFVQMREWAIENKDLSRRLSELENYFIEHCKDYKSDIKEIYEAIDLLMDRTKPTQIGFIKQKKD